MNAIWSAHSQSTIGDLYIDSAENEAFSAAVVVALFLSQLVQRWLFDCWCLFECITMFVSINTHDTHCCIACLNSHFIRVCKHFAKKNKCLNGKCIVQVQCDSFSPIVILYNDYSNVTSNLFNVWNLHFNFNSNRKLYNQCISYLIACVIQHINFAPHTNAQIHTFIWFNHLVESTFNGFGKINCS